MSLTILVSDESVVFMLPWWQLGGKTQGDGVGSAGADGESVRRETSRHLHDARLSLCRLGPWVGPDLGCVLGDWWELGSMLSVLGRGMRNCKPGLAGNWWEISFLSILMFCSFGKAGRISQDNFLGPLHTQQHVPTAEVFVFRHPIDRGKKKWPKEDTKSHSERQYGRREGAVGRRFKWGRMWQ